MINEWQSAVEQVVVPATTNGARILGFTSPASGAGVTSFARAVAETLARSGADVLYVDLASPLRRNGPVPPRAANSQTWKEPVTERACRFQIVAPANLDARFYCNNVRWLRGELTRMLRTYSNIVVDVAPLLADDTDRVNALAAATACDAVVMVCTRAQLTQQDLLRALQMTDSTEANLIGTVFNEKDYSAPSEEISGWIRGWCPNARLGRYLADKVAAAELLR